jgi:hypothetical protein
MLHICGEDDRWSSPKIVHSEFVARKPDAAHPVYSTELGIYEPRCGLRNIEMSWGRWVGALLIIAIPES